MGRSLMSSSGASLLGPVQGKEPVWSIKYPSEGARQPKLDFTCTSAGRVGASGLLPARNSVRTAAESSIEVSPRPRLRRWRTRRIHGIDLKSCGLRLSYYRTPY